jgi:hypothetical protein
MWSEEAEAKIGRAPDFVRGIARTAVIRQAQSEGHTFITSRFVDKVMKAMMPGGTADAADAVQQTFERLDWSPQARELIDGVADPSLRENIGLRAEKSARRDASETVQPEHVRPFIGDAERGADSAPKLTWRAASLARLQRVPEAFREQVRISVEGYVRERGQSAVEGETAEAAFVAARESMCPVDHAAEDGGGKS